MNQKSVGLTLRAIFLALALILVAGPALPPLDGVAYAQSAAPTLTAVNAPGGGVQVSWNAVTGADSYELYKQQEGGSWSAAMSMTVTSYTDSSVTAGASYFYIVRAVAAGVPGAWSNTPRVTIPGGTTAPTGQPTLTATPSGTDAVDLSWTAVSGAATYDLRRWNTATSNWDSIGGNNLSGTSWSDTGLASGIYHYVIRAVNAAGSGPWSYENGAGYTSASLEATTDVPELSLTHEVRGVIELSWTAVGGGAMYDLQRRKSTGSYERLPEDLLSARTYTDNNDVAGDYYYRVRASIDGVPGDWSNEEMTRVPASSRRPGTPGNVSATATGPTEIVLSWDAGTPNNATEYKVQWQSGNQDWSANRQAIVTDESYTHTGLFAETEYTYRVQAANVNGASDWSDEFSGTTYRTGDDVAGQLGPPTGVIVKDASTGSVESRASATPLTSKLKISWNKVPDATHYLVYKWSGTAWEPAKDGDGDATNNADGLDLGNASYITGRSYTDSAVTVGMTYFYIVSAVIDGNDDDVFANPIASPDYAGEWSTYVSGKTKEYKPGAPTLQAVARGGDAIWLAWTGADASAGNKIGATSGYELQYRTSGSNFKSITLEEGATNHLHQGLQRSSMTYLYRVRATNASGPGGWSEVKEVKAASQARPATPANVKVMDASSFGGTGFIMRSKLKVSWTKVPEVATGDKTVYEVQRWTGSTWTAVGDPTKETNVTDVFGDADATDLDGNADYEGKKHYYVVRAVTNGVAGEWSAAVSGTTKADRPVAPADPVVTTVGEKMLRLSWASVTGAASYELRYIKVAGSPTGTARLDQHWTVVEVSGTHHILSGLEAGTSYEYQVRAVGSGNVSGPWAPETLAAVVTRPARPADFKATPPSVPTAEADLEIVLTWKAVNYQTAVGADGDPAGYQVQRITVGDTSSTWTNLTTQPADGSVVTVTDPATGGLGLDSQKTYRYRIRATGGTTRDTYSYWVYVNATTPSEPQ